jgi:hypothetical protein
MFAGNVTTVNPRSELNAMRNPALMSRQKEDIFSIIYIYSSLINSETESDVSISGIGINSDYSLDESYDGATLFSGVWVSGKSAYGLGLSKTGDGQVKFTSSDFILSTGKITEEKRYLGSSFLLSYSYRLSSKQSIGLLVETIFSNEFIEKDDTAANKKTETSITKISSGATLGYYIHENQYSFGAMFKPGMFGTQKRSYDLTDKTSSAKEQKDISSHYVHNEGPGIILGVGLRTSNRLMFVFEGGGLFPYTKEEKSCTDALAEQTEKTNLSYALMLRTGMDYSFNRFFGIGFGGTYTRYSADIDYSDNAKTSSFCFSIMQLMAGIDIRPSKDWHLLVGLGYNRIIQDMNMNESGNIKIKLDVIQDSINYTAGISSHY